MNPISCEMALVGLVKSVGGVTASDKGKEGIIWEGSLEGCLSLWAVSGHLRECPISGTLASSWLSQLGQRPWLGKISLVWAAAPRKKTVSFGLRSLEGLDVITHTLGLFSKVFPKEVYSSIWEFSLC